MQPFFNKVFDSPTGANHKNHYLKDTQRVCSLSILTKRSSNFMYIGKLSSE